MSCPRGIDFNPSSLIVSKNGMNIVTRNRIQAHVNNISSDPDEVKHIAEFRFLVCTLHESFELSEKRLNGFELKWK